MKKWKQVVLHFGLEIVFILMTIYGVINFKAVIPPEPENVIGLAFCLIGFPLSVTGFVLLFLRYVFGWGKEAKEKEEKA